MSSEHEHASPTVIGIWGPASHQLAYLKQVAAMLTRTLERAYASVRPATITSGQGDAPWVADRVIPEGNAFEGWPRDGSIGTLWARDARTGQTIATYATEPGYPNIVYGPGDMIAKNGTQAAVLSSDFPNYADAYIEQRLGGVAIVTDGTLGNQTGPLQTDDVASPDLPPQDGMRQTRAFDDVIHMGELIGNLVIGSLAHGSTIAKPTLGAAEQYIETPVDNAALIGITAADEVDGEQLMGTVTGGQLYPADRSFLPPYGAGGELSTWVTGFRVGDLLFLTMPGEFFPEIHAAWDQNIHGTAGDFVIGAAQDFLGYEYPAYAFPFTLEGSDEHIFNPSVTLGDQVVAAGEQDAQQLGFQAELTPSEEVSALQNDYLRAFKPGVQVLAFPAQGDLAADGGGFTPTIEGVSQAARVSATGACVADTLLPCPLPPAPMGGFQWKFGDGSSATTAPQVFARAWFSPFIRHTYRAPGTYSLTVTAADQNGQTDTMTLPIRVYPALRVRIVRRRLHAGRAGQRRRRERPRPPLDARPRAADRDGHRRGRRDREREQIAALLGGVQSSAALANVVGKRVRRQEDPRFITGQGRYVDDIAIPGALHVTFVRSPWAHARINGIDASRPRRGPASTCSPPADIELGKEPPPAFLGLDERWHRPYLGRRQGALVRRNRGGRARRRPRERSADAAELVEVDYEPLPVVIDPVEAAADEVLVFEDAGTNICIERPAATSDEELFGGCEVVASGTIRSQRIAACPIEPRAAAARVEDDDRLTVWLSTQTPHQDRMVSRPPRGRSGRRSG